MRFWAVPRCGNPSANIDGNKNGAMHSGGEMRTTRLDRLELGGATGIFGKKKMDAERASQQQNYTRCILTFDFGSLNSGAREIYWPVGCAGQLRRIFNFHDGNIIKLIQSLHGRVWIVGSFVGIQVVVMIWSGSWIKTGVKCSGASYQHCGQKGVYIAYHHGAGRSEIPMYAYVLWIARKQCYQTEKPRSSW